MIPQSFDEWKKCITVNCGIALSAEFVEKRISVLSNPNHPSTKQFVRLYGEQYRNIVVHWFKRVLE